MNITQNIDIAEQIKEFFVNICGESYVITDNSKLYPYSKDLTLNLSFPFDILIKPGNSDEIVAILTYCNKHKVPVTPRGGGSGVTGGALPVNRGVILSLERLNKIIEVNTFDGYVLAEAGVITADLCAAVEKEGLYFPVAPSSSAFSFIGGNVAENAGSINSCKYGTTSDYVLNLEVVLPTGEVIWTGANVSKNATGFNITQLFVGSEGTLGIITKIVYRLIHKPRYEVSLLVNFTSTQVAILAIKELKKIAVHPSAVELIGLNALHMTAVYLNKPLPLINQEMNCHVLIQLQEEHEQVLYQSMELIATVFEKYSGEQILIANTQSEKEKLWMLRHNIGAAMVSEGRKYRDIDVAVPLSMLDKYIARTEEICRKQGILLVYFGHALDGNLHTMLVMNEKMTTDEERKLTITVKEIYSYAIELGGVISGEHGIGYLQKEFMNLQFSSEQLRTMKQLKMLFDPNGILNPGKIL